MRPRAGIATLGIVTTAALALVALAPWLNPCTGPLRFANCVEMEKSAVSNALAPWLFCPLGVCDHFPSLADRAVRILVELLIVTAVGYLTSRTVLTRKILFGVAAVITTVVIAR